MERNFYLSNSRLVKRRCPCPMERTGDCISRIEPRYQGKKEIYMVNV
jgi:hypothetical protein